MVGWHHQLDGHESEQAPGVGDEQGSLACCSPWGRKESDTTEWLNLANWTDSLICLFLLSLPLLLLSKKDFKKKDTYFYLLIWLHQVFLRHAGSFSCSVWDLDTWPEIELGSPGLRAKSLNHWTTRKVPPKKNFLITPSFFPSFQISFLYFILSS